MNERTLIIGFSLFLLFFVICFSFAIAYGQDKMINILNERCTIEPNPYYYEKQGVPIWQLNFTNITFKEGIT